MQDNSQKNILLGASILFIALITFFIIFQILTASQNQKNLSEQQVIQEAKAHFQGMVDTRSWNAQYGGVYVKAKNGLKPWLPNQNSIRLSTPLVVSVAPESPSI